MQLQKWLDRIVAFVSPHAGIRRSRARAALEAVGKPQREPQQQGPRARSFGLWWRDRMAARRGWDMWAIDVQ